jgi:hypothetical protein
MNSSRLLRRLNAVVVLMTTSNAPFSTAAIFVAAGAWQRFSKEFTRMKKAMICALLSLTMVCCGTALYAQMQDGSSPGQSGSGMGQGQGMGQGSMRHTPATHAGARWRDDAGAGTASSATVIKQATDLFGPIRLEKGLQSDSFLERP